MEHYSYASPPFQFNETGFLCPLDCFLNCPTGCVLFTLPPLPPPLFEDDHSKQPISPFVIALLIIFLGGFFVLVSYFTIIVKVCSNWRNSRRRRQSGLGDNTARDDFIDENNHEPAVDHHIWFIHTVGLEESVIKAIAVFKYKKGDGLVEGTSCSICLGEFSEDESVRLLPKCSHAFHLPCIDTWLGSHRNCPLCRAPIVCNSVVGNTSSDISVSDESQAGNVVIDISQTEEVEEEHEVSRRDIDIIEKVGMVGPLSNYDVRALSDLVDKHRVIDNEILEPVRRSVSMDFTSASKFCLSVVSSSQIEDEIGPGKLVLDKEAASSSVFRWLSNSSSKGTASMKRSLSNGNKFLPSKLSRSGCNQIIPL